MVIKHNSSAYHKKQKRQTQPKMYRSEPKPAAEGDESEEQIDENDNDNNKEEVNEEEHEGESEDTNESEDSEESSAGDAPAVSTTRHIRPCICDLDSTIKKRVAEHHKLVQRRQLKFEKRVREIEAELARLEEERLEREREQQEQEELFGDEYELVGKKKKRKKRSARRASMVSLGVKQVINWKKDPRLPVKYNQTYMLRHDYTAYCGRRPYPPSPVIGVDFRKEPTFKVRETISSNLRTKTNLGKKNDLIQKDDKRPRFETVYYT